MEKVSRSGQVKLAAKGDERLKTIPPTSSTSTRRMSRLEKPRKEKVEIIQQDKMLTTVCILFQPAARHPAGAGLGERSHGKRPPKTQGDPGLSLRGPAGAELPLPRRRARCRRRRDSVSSGKTTNPAGNRMADTFQLPLKKQGAGDRKVKKQLLHIFFKICCDLKTF